MTDATTILSILPAPEHGNGVAKMCAAFERFCLTAGVAGLEQMLQDGKRFAARVTAAVLSAPAGAGVPRLSQREAMAQCRHGAALDRRRLEFRLKSTSSCPHSKRRFSPTKRSTGR